MNSHQNPRGIQTVGRAALSVLAVPTLDELAEAFDQLWRAERALDRLMIEAGGGTHEDGLAYDGLCAQLCDVINQITALPAQKHEHVVLKARALEWAMFIQHYDGSEPTSDANERLTLQIIRGILSTRPAG